MPVFPNAHHLVIDNSQFTENTFNCGPTGIDILLDASVPEAAVDSGAWEYPPCLPATLEKHVDDITGWATVCINERSPPYVYWMKGPAGAGKTVVARTAAEKLKEQSYLGATFFFSSDGRDDHTRLFTTLAYQLATMFPDFRDILDRKVRQDKTLVGKRISSQFDALIVGPLRELEERGKGLPGKVIFIDGLDECRNKDAHREILEIILESVRDCTTPFCWAFFSRPEPHIEAAFHLEDIAPLCRFALLPIYPQTEEQGRLLLKNEIQDILRRFSLMFFSPWDSLSTETLTANEDTEEVPRGSSRSHSAFKFLLAGGVAGAVSRTYTAPLDRLKVFLVTRALNLGSLPLIGTSSGTQVGAKTMANAANRIYTEGGIGGFWTGNGLSVMRIVPESMIKFLAYESAKHAFAKHWDHVDDPSDISALSRFLSGGTGGIISQIGTYPLETLKTQMMSKTGGKWSFTRTIQHLHSMGGYRAFYRGLPIGLVVVFPYSAIDMSTFETLKLAYIKSTGKKEPSAAAQLTFGGISGTVGATAVYPLNLVRMRLQASGSSGHPQRYTGIWDVMAKTLQTEGWTGFYRGLIPTLTKVVPTVAMSYFVYEQTKLRLETQEISDDRTNQHGTKWNRFSWPRQETDSLRGTNQEGGSHRFETSYMFSLALHPSLSAFQI